MQKLKSMRYQIIIILFLFSVHISAQSTPNADQQRIIDSLNLELIQTDKDSLKINMCFHLNVHWFALSEDSAKYYLQKGLSYSFLDDYPREKANLLYRAGIMKESEDYNEAIAYFKESNELYIQEGMGDLLFPTYSILVELYSKKRNLDSALHYQQLALDLMPENSYGWKNYLSHIIASLYSAVGQKETSLKHYHQLKRLQIQEGNLGELGWVYYRIGSVWYEMENQDSALHYYRKSMTFKNDLLSWKYCSLLSGMGNVLITKGEPEEGVKLIERAAKLMKTENNPRVLASIYASHAYGLNELNQHEKAAKMGLKSLSILEELKIGHSIPEVFEELIISHENLGNFEEAFKYQKEWFAIKEKLLKTQNQQMLSELEIKNETAAKQNQLDMQNIELSRQRLLNWIIGIVAFLLLGFSFMIYRNNRQKQRINAQLRKLDTSKSRFFANISHELRTPLTLILSPLENAIQKVKSKSAKADLQLAHSNSKKLFTLVNEIMDLSKLESGKMQMKETAVDLEKLLRRILFSYQSLAQVRGYILGFSYHLPENLAVKLDIGKFEKVLNNLLSNAFKYSKPDGVITLRVGRINGLLKIEVQDTGIGIPPEQLEKIFDRFYQIEGEEEPLQGGTGIGLAYAKEIAQLFGGDLRVESELNKGSNFILTIPLKKTVLKKVISSDAEELPKPVHSKTETPLYSIQNDRPHLLIVEDNPEMSKFLVQTLSSQFLCTTAIDGIEALKKMENQKFDLITSDVMMPNMDGFTFLEKVHESEDFLTTPVIMLTARTLEEDKLKGFQLGVDDYLTKPFSTRELIARINNLLKNKLEREQWLLENKSLDSKEKETEQPLSFEKTLLKTAENLVLKNLSNSNFKITELARELNYSPRQVARIVKKLTGLSPVGFVREIRLQKAYQMIESRQFATISEVRFEVGIEDATHFKTKFQERFGRLPNEVKST